MAVSPKALQLYAEMKRRASSFVGLERKEILDSLYIGNPEIHKSINSEIIERIFGIGYGILTPDEVSRAGLKIKSIVLGPNSYPKEHMSFPYERLDTIATGKFEDTKFYKALTEHAFIFGIWSKQTNEKDSPQTFLGIYLWTIPDDALEKCQEEFKIIQSILISGHIYRKGTKGDFILTFPKPSKEGVSHIRPHAQNAKDVDFLPVADVTTGKIMITKHGFWLNRWFIGDQIKMLISSPDRI